MNYDISITVNGQYDLLLPFDGVPVTIAADEWNPFTNKVEEMRPLSTAQVHNIPLSANRETLEKLKGEPMTAVLSYNGVPIISGPITDYSENEQTDEVAITILSGFKEAVNAMGDTARGLAVVPDFRKAYVNPDENGSQNLNRLSFVVRIPAITSLLAQDTYYNPMDTTTGSITPSATNVAEYCKRPVYLAELFTRCLSSLGWTIDTSSWTDTMRHAVLVGTNEYYCSAYGSNVSRALNFGNAGDTESLTFNSWLWRYDATWYTISSDGKSIQYRQPARNLAFRLIGDYSVHGAVLLSLKEGTNVIYETVLTGAGFLNATTGVQNVKDGFDALTLTVEALTDDAAVTLTNFHFYDIFSIYETNNDPQLVPYGYIFPLLDNFPETTVLELYREFLTLFQYAQKVDDVHKTISYYPLSKIEEEKFTGIDVGKYLVWDGYVPVEETSLGLAAHNTVQYKNGGTRAMRFAINSDALRANNTYFESMFAEAADNAAWGALVVPSLKYTTKTVNGVPFEYLAYTKINPMIAVVGQKKTDGPFAGLTPLTSLPLTMGRLAGDYWKTLLSWLSADNKMPQVFTLRLQVPYFLWKSKLQQSNAVWYKDGYAVIVGGEYDLLNQEFTGKFLKI